MSMFAVMTVFRRSFWEPEEAADRRRQDKKPHIAARNGRLFSMTWNPIPQCAPLSVNVRDGRRGSALMGNSMG
jgi:hypothetical protein